MDLSCLSYLLAIIIDSLNIYLQPVNNGIIYLIIIVTRRFGYAFLVHHCHAFISPASLINISRIVMNNNIVLYLIRFYDNTYNNYDDYSFACSFASRRFRLSGYYVINTMVPTQNMILYFYYFTILVPNCGKPSNVVCNPLGTSRRRFFLFIF